MRSLPSDPAFFPSCRKCSNRTVPPASRTTRSSPASMVPTHSPPDRSTRIVDTESCARLDASFGSWR